MRPLKPSEFEARILLRATRAEPTSVTGCDGRCHARPLEEAEIDLSRIVAMGPMSERRWAFPDASGPAEMPLSH